MIKYYQHFDKNNKLLFIILSWNIIIVVIIISKMC